MNSKTTRQFRNHLEKLPTEIQQQAKKAYSKFRENPQHPSLRFKKVHASNPIYSVRINDDYRAVGIMNDNEIIWFWIGTHTDYDKLLSNR
ncbi:type II toxin-antitoxin system RelE family toxin [Rubinisphaera italica]|uniref:type II toxin-antitoxin system RelE family toxin n=1 Tax=Rubinisphaera italica TaxID=2527969 RepID=UPI0036F226A9